MSFVYSNTMTAGRENPFNFNNRSWQSEIPTLKNTTAKACSFSVKLLFSDSPPPVPQDSSLFSLLLSPEWIDSVLWKVILRKLVIRNWVAHMSVLNRHTWLTQRVPRPRQKPTAAELAWVRGRRPSNPGAHQRAGHVQRSRCYRRMRSNSTPRGTRDKLTQVAPGEAAQGSQNRHPNITNQETTSGPWTGEWIPTQSHHGTPDIDPNGCALLGAWETRQTGRDWSQRLPTMHHFVEVQN